MPRVIAFGAASSARSVRGMLTVVGGRQDEARGSDRQQALSTRTQQSVHLLEAPWKRSTAAGGSRRAAPRRRSGRYAGRWPQGAVGHSSRALLLSSGSQVRILSGALRNCATTHLLARFRRLGVEASAAALDSITGWPRRREWVNRCPEGKTPGLSSRSGASGSSRRAVTAWSGRQSCKPAAKTPMRSGCDDRGGRRDAGVPGEGCPGRRHALRGALGTQCARAHRDGRHRPASRARRCRP